MNRVVAGVMASLVAVGASSPRTWAGEVQTAITYQGQLKQAGVPVNGLIDLTVAVYDAAEEGQLVAGPLIFDGQDRNSAPVDVVDGLLTVQLDFGAEVFTGAPRFLHVEVRSPHDPTNEGRYIPLSPRQAITAAPMALQVSGLVTDTSGGLQIGGDLRSAGDVAARAYGSNVPVVAGATCQPNVLGLCNGNNFIECARIDPACNFGIGTASPMAKLHIGGTPGVDGIMFPDGTMQTTAAGPGGSGFWAANGADIYNTNAGNIGIGTDTPTARLQITDADGMPGIDVANNWFAIRGTHNSTSGSFPGVLGDTDSLSANANGVRGVVNSATPGADSAGVLGINNGTGVNGVGVLGRHAGSGVGVRGEVTNADGHAGYFVGGTNYFQGNVGIGTADPQHRLDIYGADARITSTILDGPHLQLKGGSLTSPLSFTIGALDFVDVNDLVPGGVSYGRSLLGDRLLLRAGGEVRMAVDQDGRVGIGTVVPQVSLHVSATTDVSLGGGGVFVIGDVAAGNLGFDGNEIMARNDGAASTLYLNHEGGNVAISASGDGRVGIGTSSPNSRLHVTASTEQTAQFNQFGNQPGVVISSFSASSGYSALTVNGFSNSAAALNVTGKANVDVLQIRGADVAEKFPASEKVGPGMVMEIDPTNAGKLRVSRDPYNRRVAGVVSGAGDLPTGAILGHLPGHGDAPPIALSGRVWVNCDATQQAIVPGDLLTTSSIPGCAMKAVDHARAQGAVLGKAMTSLPKGTGLVLVLVALQ